MGKLYGSETVVCSDGNERVAHYTEPNTHSQDNIRARIKVKGKTVSGHVFMQMFWPDRKSANGKILPYWEDEVDYEKGPTL
jgi:hypothetical protein